MGSGSQKNMGAPSWTLCGVGVVLVALHLAILHKLRLAGLFSISLVAWPAVIYLYRQRWSILVQERFTSGVVVGILVLAGTVATTVSTRPYTHALSHLYPLAAGVGFLILAHGFRGLRVCWRELTILLCLGGPRLLMGELEMLATATARLAAFIVWHLGLDVEIVGTRLNMAEGAVVVDQGCAGPGIISKRTRALLDGGTFGPIRQ